ncbi:hypothetical protein MPSEU_000587500 [Mayamaea pseudoterrestris]|nr:hypothetical protein MPSEU_000587500 [Mayamaea pseudoterrestris]
MNHNGDKESEASQSFDEHQLPDPASLEYSNESWKGLLWSRLLEHPIQNLVLALIVARVIQLFMSFMAATLSTEKDGTMSHIATNHHDQAFANDDPRLRSRLLNAPLPNHLELEESVEEKQATSVVESDVSVIDDSPTQLRPTNETEWRKSTLASAEKLSKEQDSVNTEMNVDKVMLQSERHECDNPWAALDSFNTEQAVINTSPKNVDSNSNNNDNHPGLDAFYHWFDLEVSLFRIYERGRTDYEVVPPYNPSSRRGTVKVALKVLNQTSHQRITAYWVDYKGKLVDKGTFEPHETWVQTTWVDHPWVFSNDENVVLLHYVPYRIVPTTTQEPTTDPDNSACGMHRFTIKDAAPSDALIFRCAVDDAVLPFPACDYFSTPEFALDKVLLHCYRMNYTGWLTLTKYLSKVAQHPDLPKYRRIRTANAHFAQDVWNTPARGVLLALGFVERQAHVELAGDVGTLSRERVQDVSRLLYHLERWQAYAESGVLAEQPEGADGFGRAGFGRAGQMNM